MPRTTKKRIEEECPIPSHFAHAVTAVRAETPEKTATDRQPDKAIKAAWQWVRQAPAERAPLPAGVLLYGAGWAANHYHLPWWGILSVTAAGTIGTYAVSFNRASEPRTWGNTAAAATSGVWLTLADVFGPAAWNGGLTWGFLSAYGVGYGLHLLGLKLSGRPRGPKRVKGRTHRIDWEGYFDGWGMAGATVISSSATRLGERALISTKGTRRRASSFCTASFAERVAEDFDTKKSRVTVREGDVAGQIEINVRLRDPWAEPILHPLLDPEHEIELPDVADARQPLTIGQDPETGDPLEFVAWDEDGAAHWLIVAIKGGGKTVLLNNILERLTAADNATVWGIDVSKAKDLRRWRDSGALDLAACGPNERARGVAMLELAADGVGHRAEHNTSAVFEPRPGHPLHVVVIDEVDALFAPGDELTQRAIRALKTITSKGRSESVGLIIVGQRGTAAWMGGADIRANLDRQALLKLARSSEANNALGDAAVELPNMAKYGEGHPGVVALTNMGSLTGLGRSFMLKDLDKVEELGTGRKPSPFEPDLVEFWGGRYAKLKAGSLPASTPAPAGQGQQQMPATPEERAAERARIKATLTLVQTPTGDLAEKLRQHSAARWAMVRGETPAVEVSTVPAEVRAKVAPLIGRPEGASMAEITQATGYSSTHAGRLMGLLRDEGVARLEGAGRAARWHAATTDGHAQSPEKQPIETPRETAHETPHAAV